MLVRLYIAGLRSCLFCPVFAREGSKFPIDLPEEAYCCIMGRGDLLSVDQVGNCGG